MHFVLFLRFFTLQNDFDNGRNTSDLAKGLFRMRTNRSMDAELWFQNYKDTLADKMPDSCYYHLPSCQTKKTVYITYAEETNGNGIFKPLSQAQFLRMWREKFKRVIIPKVSITYNPLQEFKIHLIQYFFKAIKWINLQIILNEVVQIPQHSKFVPQKSINLKFFFKFQTSRFSKCGVCVLLKEHLQSTTEKSVRESWLEKKRLHIEQQWYILDMLKAERNVWRCNCVTVCPKSLPAEEEQPVMSWLKLRNGVDIGNTSGHSWF